MKLKKPRPIKTKYSCPICGEKFPKWERDKTGQLLNITMVVHYLLEHPKEKLPL